MASGLDTLTKREREVLRLLGRGHDAKSIATDLDLSVHTINERLREVRRKLGVSSSREAARLLLTHESNGEVPQKLTDKEIGVADTRRDDEQMGRRTAASRISSHATLGVVMLITLIAAAAALSSNDGQAPQASGQTVRAMANPSSWFEEADYPAEARKEKARGRTGYRLELSAGPVPKVTKCEITSSSGHAALDAATCRVLISKARFMGALDAAGRHVPGEFSGRIDWVAP
jgi:DNA-binding CsgD family transcriptional regulator